MTDEQPKELDAVKRMWDAYHELRGMGWNDPIHCPKDGSTFLVIEPGSTGIHEAHYEGEWPSGSWWIHEANDLWPSRPCLFKLKPPVERT